MKRLILRILFWLLGDRIEYKDVDDKQMRAWLADQSKDLRFRHYFRKRDLELLKTLGSGLQEQSYWMTLGRRLELLKLIQQVDRAAKNEKGA